MLDNEWKLDDGRVILLLTLGQFAILPDGTALVSISGRTVIKGKDYIDNETRGGYLAYGVLNEKPYQQ